MSSTAPGAEKAVIFMSNAHIAMVRQVFLITNICEF